MRFTRTEQRNQDNQRFDTHFPSPIRRCELWADLKIDAIRKLRKYDGAVHSDTVQAGPDQVPSIWTVEHLQTHNIPVFEMQCDAIKGQRDQPLFPLYGAGVNNKLRSVAFLEWRFRQQRRLSIDPRAH